MWKFLRQENENSGGDSPAAAIAEAIIPDGELVRRGDGRTVRAAKEILVSRMGMPGAAAFNAMAHALEWGTAMRQGRRFSKLSQSEREDILRQWAQNELTRWPFLLFSGLLKGAHFDNPDHFESYDVPYDRSGKPEEARWRRQVQNPEDIEDGQRIECDVVVIGTGAGGAVVGAKLAAQGYAVAFVEEGLFYRRDSFDGRALPAHEEFFRHGTVALGNTVIPVQMGKMVGGSTAVNAATCFRTPPWVLDRWCEQIGSDSFRPKHMERHFDEVEAVVNAHEPPPVALGKAARLFFEGCEEKGYRHGPVSRNVAGCTGEGVCEFGCPEDARQSTDISYVPRALRKGAVVFCGTRAERVSIRNGRAAGVEARTVNGKRLRVDARATVVACGAVPTPAFLLHQGLCNSSGQVGRNLSLHPATGAAALFDETIRGFDSVPQSYFSDQFLRSEGFLLAGAQLPLDVGGALLPLYGESYLEAAQNLERLAASTVITGDDYRPGRVRSVGDGCPLITYRMTRRNVEKLRTGMVRLAEIYFAAGARKVYPLMPRIPVLESADDIDALRDLDVGASDFITTSWHPLGTCQMGTDPSKSVVDTGHESFDLDRLFIVDGSSLPGPTGVNPQITIMAMANRAAEEIMRRI